jgi:3,4-dihydroxy 2-butanone 4-phosphate synthase/GTP cyclohydrolase II
MTNNPDKVAALEEYGLAVIERVPVEVPPRAANREYLETKRVKFGHLLSLVAEKQDSGARKQDSEVGSQDPDKTCT